MYTRLLTLWENFRTSFWFVPSLLMVAATIGAIALVRFDLAFGEWIQESFPFLEMSPPSARAILSSIVGAMVTSTGVVFSITIVALSLASSQFGSRLIRTFRNRRSTHFTLGIFVSTSLYCILILTAIREVNDYVFVPTTAVVAGIAMTVGCLATLIFYIHDMSGAIQAAQVIRSSANDLHTAIGRMFPKKLGVDLETDASEVEVEKLAARHSDQLIESDSHVVTFQEVGYIKAIKNESVMELANDFGLIIHLLVRSGDFVQPNVAIARIFPGEGYEALTRESVEKIARRTCSCLIIGANRTPTQDVRYAFDELVEIAVRALSPGINDPYTAINCIDRIHAELNDVRNRKLPSRFRLNNDSQLRVIAEPVTLEECVDGSLRVIEHYARESPAVAKRVTTALRDLQADG